MPRSATPERHSDARGTSESDLQVLSQLLAAVGVLPALATTRKTAEFALEVLKTAFPASASAVCVRDVGHPLGTLADAACDACSTLTTGEDRSAFLCPLAARRDVRAFALRTLDGHYGYLMVRRTPDDDATAGVRDPYLVNFANSVATSLENRWQRQELEEGNARLRALGSQLQQMVNERTEELAATNVRLQTESNRNEALLRNASDGIHILDFNGNVLEVSDSFCEMLGYTRDELLSANVALWDARWSPAELQARVAALLGTDGGEAFETVHRRRDGTLIATEVTTRPIQLDGQRVLFNSSRDITRRKVAEDALRESEHRYHGLFDQANEGLLVMTLEGRLIDVNAAFAEMHGYSVEELRCMDIGQLDVLRDDAMRGRAEIGRRLNAGETVRFEVEHLHRHGHRIALSVTASLIDFGGQPCCLAFHQDITERRHLEQVHLRAQKLESLGRLTGGIAHDFNNILAAIQGNADLAVKDVAADHPAAESLREIRKASARARELVRRIMAFGRPEEPRPGAVDLGTVVGEVLKLLRATLPARIALITDFAADTPKVMADAGQVHEAIVNLTTNAAFAIGPQSGSITYRLESVQVDAARARGIPSLKPGRYAQLDVIDSGCGMDADTMTCIFDAFYTTKPAGEGTGLGLSMVHGIMASHGGAVTVESEVGRGSTFRLYFPAAQHVAGPATDAPATATAVRASGLRVLYVDDEEPLLSLAKRVLARLGYTALGFTDPRAALAAVRDDPSQFDLVITDLSMPGMSGFALARELRALRPDAPILMTTGNIGVEDEERARAAGIQELVLKPVSMSELERALDRARAGAPASSAAAVDRFRGVS